MYDCIVMGGGPAGSTTAALVAEAGFRTLLVEREELPRYHIGESLMPETYWTFKRLGILDEMRKSAFPKKHSVHFVSHTGRESAPFYFREFDDSEAAQTWQVRRADFDKLLWDNAAAKGAECRDCTRVHEVLFDNGRAVGVTIARRDGGFEDLDSKVVVDATGIRSLLGNRLGVREQHAQLRKASIWGYYRGAKRDKGVDEGATIVLHTCDKRAWFWYIPLPDDITSVGVVGDVDYLLKNRGTPDEVFEEELVKCPAVVERLMEAELTSDFRVLRDFSYISNRAAGPGWVLVGDAYAFLDPIYSSGVFFALKTGEMAADCIIDGLASGDTSGEQLGKWSASFADGMEWMRKLVYAFYTDSFSFGRFIRDYPQHKRSLTELLVGKVFNSGHADVFRDMEPYLQPAETEAPR